MELVIIFGFFYCFVFGWIFHHSLYTSDYKISFTTALFLSFIWPVVMIIMIVSTIIIIIKADFM